MRQLWFPVAALFLSACTTTPVPPADPQAVADGLRQLARLDAATRQRMGESGRQFVLDNHTYPVLAARFLQACQSD